MDRLRQTQKVKSDNQDKIQKSEKEDGPGSFTV